MSSSDHKNTPADTLRTALLAKDKEARTKRAAFVEASSKEPPRRNDLLPLLHLVDRDPRALKAPLRNVRALEPAHVKEVANSIAVLGFVVPVVIDGTDNVLDGLVRVEAAKLHGLTSIPCVVANHLTPHERRLLRLAVNKLGEKGSWSLPELKLELEELIVLDVPIETTGFGQTEIDGILSDEDVQSLEQGPLAPAPGTPAVARRGDVFRLGPHWVSCGDAREGAVLHGLMAGNVARMVLTDEPYNVAIAGHVTGGSHREFAMASGEMTDAEFDHFNVDWIGAALPHLVDGGILATFIDWRGLGSVTAAALGLGLSQVNLVVWGKTNAGMGSLYRSQHELMPLFKVGRAAHVNNIDLGRKGRHRTNLWSYPGASTLGSDARQGLQHHPTVKPTAMLMGALLDLTHRGETVLDPFLGSGSTLIAAEKTGRVCRGTEIDPLYVDVIARRYEQVTGRPAVLEGSGETFATVEQRRSSETS